MPLSPELLQLITQGGFTALFVWLLFDTRKEARDLQQRAAQREEKLMSELRSLSESYGKIAQAVAEIARNTAREFMKRGHDE